MPTYKPNVKMRRTRWDQKHDDDPSLPSSSSWDNSDISSHNRVSVDWNHESNPPIDVVGRSREHLNTPHPLDYSRQSDKRADGNELSSKELERERKINSHHKEATAVSVPDQRPPLFPIPPMPYVADLHPLYTGSNHNAQLGYQSQISWNHPSHGFYTNYHPNMYNVKWWEDVDHHMPHHNLNKDKYEVGRPGPWSKMSKSNDRTVYDFNRRYGKSPGMSLDRSSRICRDQRPYLHSNNMNQRYSKYDNNPQAHNRVWRNNNNNCSNGRLFNSGVRNEFPNFYDWNQNTVDEESYRPALSLEKIDNNYPKTAQNEDLSKDKNTDCSNNDNSIKMKDPKPKKVFKKDCKKNSTAEKAKKKALAIAANKLKMSFFAAKKQPNSKSTKKFKGQTVEKSDSNHKNEGNSKDKVQDLSIPKSIPKDGTSLEHDIDIKFSAREWESVGRGEGGTRNFFDLPGSANDSKDNGDNSDSDSVQTIEEDFEARDVTDVDSENSDFYSEDEDINGEWNNLKLLSPVKPLRRRHVSETCNINSLFVNRIPNLSKARRTRSFSTSQVEEIIPSDCTNTKSVSSNLKNMLVKQLLTMDKKSLVELVNNPKSRKAQYMMSHFMKMHKVALSQRLNQIRFKNAPSTLHGDDDDDLQILLTISPAQLENLSPDILQQVKDILALEESGKAQQVWEEVSLSLADLVSGFEDRPTSIFHEKALEIPTIPEEECGSKDNETNVAENVEDPDCQIVTPPPKRPATTITIPDSDTDNGSEGKNSDDKNKFSGEETSPCSSDEHTSLFIKPNDFVKLDPPNLINQSSLLTATMPLNQFVPPLPIKETVDNTSNCIEKELLTSVRTFAPPHPITPSSIPALSNLKQSISSLSQFPPPLPIKQSPAPTLNVFEHSMPNILPPHPIKQSPAPSVICHSETLSTRQNSECSPHSAISPSCFRPLKRLRRNSESKDKSEESLLQASAENQDEIRVPTHSLKVKQERPSPMIECGYCLHPPRSPHTPQCGYSFSSQPPPPIALLPGSPRSLGSSSQRPVPHIPPSMPRLFKQEKLVSFVSLNHINRPSSEERPKNPAPPDTANSEPPSPLPIPSPRPTVHPRPTVRPMSYTPENGFSVPVRSTPPPPHQPSPRTIKTERQTPQYICCCMRNECERNNGSRTSADFRRAGTPLNQLCDIANRLTPHTYKTEPHYLSGSRSRTPRSGILGGMFPIPQSPRCVSTSNNMTHNAISSNCQNVIDINRISIGVQTNKVINGSVDAKRSFLSNVALAKALTPLSIKIDQTTSTEDLSFEEVDHVSSMAEEGAINEAEIYNNRAVEEPELADLSEARNHISLGSGSSAYILLDFSKQEKDIYQRLQVIEKQSNDLAEERTNLTKCLENMSNLRSEKLKKLVCEETGERSDIVYTPVREENSINLVNSSIISNTNEIEKEKPSFSDNMYLVTSSQEISALHRADSPAESYSNDSEKHNIQGQRCTSSSLMVNESEEKCNLHKLDQNDLQFSASDSEAENKTSKTFQRNKIKFSMAQNCYRRQRMDSVSSSEEEMDKKSVAHSQHTVTNNLLGNEIEHDTKIEIHEFKQESELILNKFTVNQRVENNEDGENLGHNRKNSLSSPHSPKIRNSSGSEHGYSLRSRGPPSDLLDFNSDSQLSKDATMSSQEDHVDIIEEKSSISHKNSNKSCQDDEQADDELERDDSESKTLSSHKLSSDNFKRRKRKRKNKKVEVNKCKKKSDISEIYQKNSMHLQDDDIVGTISKGSVGAAKEAVDICKSEETIFKAPQPHEAPILDLKVVGNFVFTASSDGTARLFDPSTGLILATYIGHTDSVTAIQVIGQPDFRSVAPDFSVITGSEDNSINIYDGKTGALSKSKITTEPVRCFAHRWGYLFIGTDGGCGIKWNLKDKKLGEKIQFCGKGITQLIAHIEGGRKVLVVSAKTTPIMVRDAMSGLFLRTLEYVQLTVYSAMFEGSLLYSGGSDNNIYTHDFCSGNIKKTFLVGTAVSGLLLVSDHLIAVCYDGCIRVFKLPNGELTHCISVESSHKMYICSSLYKDQILLGNKNGEIVSCPLPNFCK